MIRHFPLPKHRIANRVGATITVTPWQDQFLISVRPRFSKRLYSLPLASVAQMICDRVARNEASYEVRRRAKR